MTLKPTQKKFWKAILSLEYKFLMYAGRVNTGKTYSSAILLIMLANDYPDSRIGIIRKNLTTSKRTVYQTFKKALRDLKMSYQENKADWIITLAGSGSRIEFVEADITKDKDLDKVKGLELTCALIDEANEVDQKVFNLLMTRIGRWNENGAPSFILLTCNPNNTWVKDIFYLPHTEGTLKKPFFFLEPLFEEIPIESRQLLENLPPLEYDRYVLQNWNYSDDPQQLIPFEWIRRNTVEPRKEADAMAIDPARYGDDRTVFVTSYGQDQTSIEVFTKQSTTETANIAIERMKEKGIGADKVTVDVIGLGAGVVDPMRARGYAVQAFNSAEASTKYHGLFQFKNKRSESYWTLREKLENDQIGLLNDQEAIKELTNIRYYIKDKVIYIESKDDIKKRLGFSPDKADAISMLFTVDQKGGIVSTGRNRALLQYENNKNGRKKPYYKGRF